jgi:hypothetical protein
VSLYGGLQAVATRTLAAFGNATGTLSKRTAGEYDPATAVTGEDRLETATVTVFMDTSDLQNLGRKFGADLVRGGDALALLAAGDLTPEEGDTLTLGTETWTILHVRTTPEGGNAVVHELLVRR